MNKKLITAIIGIIVTSIFVWYGFSNPKLHAKLLNLMAALTNSAPVSQSASNNSDSSNPKSPDTKDTGIAMLNDTDSADSLTAQEIINALKESTIIAQGLDVGEGTVTASNVIYSVKQGEGISVSTGQTPTITNTGVLSIGGNTGSIYLNDNGGILFDNQKLYNSDKGSAQNIFKTFKVNNEVDVKADSNSTELYFVAGTGMNIDTNNDDKTITFTNTSNSGWTDDGTIIRTTTDTDKVGIGTASPTSLFSVGSSSGFQVDSSGNLVKINAVAYSFPSSQGSANTFLKNDGSGGLTWSANSFSIPADSLDFTDFADNMTLDATTTVAQAGFNFAFSGSGNLGVGTTAPNYKLDVAGTGRFTGNLTLDSLAAGSTDTVVTHSSGTLQTRTIDSRVWGSTITDGSGIASYVARWSDANTLSTGVLYDNGTNVGIGTTAPSTKLHVVGDLRVTGAYYDSSNSAGSSTNILTSTGTGTAWSSVSSALSSTAFLQGGNSFGALATLGTNDNNSLGIRTSGVERVRISTTGNVGIGTTTPGEKLDILGNSNVSGSYKVGAIPVITYSSSRVQVDPNGWNTNFGNGAIFGNTSAKVVIGAASSFEKLGVVDGNLSIKSTSTTNGATIGSLIFGQNSYNGEWAKITSGFAGANWYNGSYLSFSTNSGSDISGGSPPERMRIDGSGNVGIGTTSPAFKLEVNGNIGPSVDSTGSGVGYNLGSASKRFDTVYASNGTINTSDLRLKTNITNLNYGLDAIMQLNPVSFNWSSNPASATKLGLIAQDVQKVIPEVVKVGDDENHTLGIYYSDLIPVTIKGIQEQQGKIQELGLQLTSLDKTVKTISGVSSDFTADTMQEATTSGALTVGILTVTGDSIFEKTVTFMGEVIHNAEVSFKGTVSFFAKAIFHSDVELLGKTRIDEATIKFDKNTVGTAMIKKGSNAVAVTFDREYDQTPSVNINVNVRKDIDQAAQDALKNLLLTTDIRYIATDVTTKGFIITLNKLAPETISFSWTAFVGTDSKTFESQEGTVTPTSAPSPTSTVSQSPAPTESVTPTANPSATLVPSPSIAISPSPTSITTISETPSVSPTP